jgi:hypothetical protein
MKAECVFDNYSYNLKWSILHDCGQKLESAVKSFLSPRKKSEFTYPDKANSLSENWKMRSLTFSAYCVMVAQKCLT